MGQGHGFKTVKPLRLIKKIVQIWCPPNGIVMDPFAGSGTTAHAVLELNKEHEHSRRFILIEQGRPERGDTFAQGLTASRVRRAITGDWASGPQSALGGGFRFTQLSSTVDADAVLALEREEMLDLLTTSYWDQSERAAMNLKRLPAGQFQYLFAQNSREEGFFLVWKGPENSSVLDRSTFKGILEEARAANLKPPYHVYARLSAYGGPNIQFYQIPNRVLEKLGFNEATEPFSSNEINEAEVVIQ